MQIPMQEALRTTRLRDGRMPQPFSVEFVSFDSNKTRSKRRSNFKTIEKAVRTKSSHDEKKNGTFTVKDLDKGTQATIHFKNILSINGKEVL